MKSDRRVMYVVSGVAAVTLVIFVGLAIGGSSDLAASQLIGKPAPRLVSQTIQHGEVSLTDYQGQFVVVNFFASWCVSCRQEHPELLAFDEAYGDTGNATLLSVTFGEPVEDSIAFMEELGGDWPVLLDQDGAAAVSFGVLSIPESFIIAPDGIVIERVAGATTKAQLESIIFEYIEQS
jgi:cytochrome c biogenesis protein CcmG, thiol:disulfide interchange protein DsbE